MKLAYSFILFILCHLHLGCKAHTRKLESLQELDPKPSDKVLWSGCSEVPYFENEGKKIFQIAGQNYTMDQFLGEGGTGLVYALKAESNQGKSLVLKIMKKDHLNSAYMDLLFHSTLRIIGAPTTRVGFGYINKPQAKDGNNENTDSNIEKEFILIKDRVAGVNFDNVVFRASLKSMNFLSPNSQKKAKKILALASQAYSRVINSGIYISDMHSRNSMWNDDDETFIMVDGNIEPNAVADKIDKKDSFGRAISVLGSVGNRIFYERYYDPKEKSSDKAKKIARARIDLYFSRLQKECAPPPEETINPPYEIDIHKVFGD